MASKQKLVDLMNESGIVYDKQIPVELIRAYWQVLCDLDDSVMEAAFRLHQRDKDRGRFFPKPADIIAAIPQNMQVQHIGAEEAWAIALAGVDEEATTVVTQEILEAFDKARPVFDSGDEVGARMAFREIYNRITQSAQAPKWFVSAGDDPVMREKAVQRALADGRITTKTAERYISLPATATVSALLANPNITAMPLDDEAKSRVALLELGKLRGMLISDKPDTETDAQRQARERREKIDLEKTKVARVV